MSMKLNVWYIQEIPGRGYQPLRFIHRNGQPELGEIWPTIEAARKACGAPNAELI